MQQTPAAATQYDTSAAAIEEGALCRLLNPELDLEKTRVLQRLDAYNCRSLSYLIRYSSTLEISQPDAQSLLLFRKMLHQAQALVAGNILQGAQLLHEVPISRTTTGVAEIDQCMNSGMQAGRVYEIAAAEPGDQENAAGRNVASCAAQSVLKMDKRVLWLDATLMFPIAKFANEERIIVATTLDVSEAINVIDRVFDGGIGGVNDHNNNNNNNNNSNNNTGTDSYIDNNGNSIPEMPPSYDTAMNQEPPPPEYIDNTFFAPLDIAAHINGTDTEVIIEGLPVGSSVSFFVTLMLTFTFQFVGFIFSYLLSMSHAGRNGAKAGLGLLIMQMGMYLHARINDVRYATSAISEGSAGGSRKDRLDADFTESTTEIDSDKNILAGSELASYMLLIAGWLVLLKSTADFMRVKRLESVILANPESFNA